jgi:hypothetical protein
MAESYYYESDNESKKAVVPPIVREGGRAVAEEK